MSLQDLLCLCFYELGVTVPRIWIVISCFRRERDAHAGNPKCCTRLKSHTETGLPFQSYCWAEGYKTNHCVLASKRECCTIAVPEMKIDRERDKDSGDELLCCGEGLTPSEMGWGDSISLDTHRLMETVLLKVVCLFIHLVLQLHVQLVSKAVPTTPAHETN